MAPRDLITDCGTVSSARLFSREVLTRAGAQARVCYRHVSCGHLGLVHESASSRLLLVRHHGHLVASQRSGRERGLAVCVLREGTGSVFIAGRGGKEGQVSTAKPGQAEMAVEAAEGEEVAVA